MVHTIQVQQYTHMDTLFSSGREFSLIEHRAHTRLLARFTLVEGNMIINSTDQRPDLELVAIALNRWAVRNCTSWGWYISQSPRLWENNGRLKPARQPTSTSLAAWKSCVCIFSSSEEETGRKAASGQQMSGCTWE